MGARTRAAGRGKKPPLTGTRPFAPFEWMLAGRYLRTRRREGFVSVIAGFSFLGIMLGVATLIVVLSVMNGFRKELLDKIVGINGHVFIAPVDTPLTDYAEVARRVAAVAGVRRAIPMVEGQAFGSSQHSGSGVLVRGVRGEDMARIDAIAGNLRQGTLENFDTAGGVAVGKRLAESLAVQVGDTVTLITPRGAATPFGTAPRIKGYPVVAIFEIGMSEFDASFVYMPLAEAQSYFNHSGDVSVIEVFLDDADRVLEARGAIEEAA
ncbi:MAG TPA: ABC transporter permease, partial [Microvirga sp.]|nr:ABC transporter permease [Microvirga sp.]